MTYRKRARGLAGMVAVIEAGRTMGRATFLAGYTEAQTLELIEAVKALVARTDMDWRDATDVSLRHLASGRCRTDLQADLFS